jgi:uncharacterized protein (DUF2147 family)
MSSQITRWRTLATLIVGAALLVSNTQADTDQEKQILGTWLTQNKDGVVAISIGAAGKLEGRIVAGSSGAKRLDEKNPDPTLRARPLLGTVMLEGFHYVGDGRWTGGTIYDPNNGKTYSCNLELTQPDMLKIRGYVGMPLFGRTEMWTRKKE